MAAPRHQNRLFTAQEVTALPAPPPTPTFRRIVPLIIASSLFMQNLDTSILGTALPAISHSLAVDPLHLNLAITSYLLSLAVFIPVSGWMADRFGSSLVFRAAILLFTIGSMFCGLADSLPELVAARILQGMGGAMMVPVGRLVLLKTTPKAELISAMFWMTMPSLVGPVLGPMIGGLIVTYTSWRWIFLVNIPVGILGMVLATRYIEDSREESVGPLDLRGFVLMGVAMVGLIFGFEMIGRHVLSNTGVVALLTAGAICLSIYVAHARRATRPIIDLGLFKLPIYASVTWGSLIARIINGATPFLLPLMFQVGFGFTPLKSGFLTFATSMGAIMMRRNAGVIYRRFGFRLVLSLTIGVCGLFFAGFGQFTPATPYVVILLALMASGFFRVLAMTSINTLAYADVPPAMMSGAATVASVVQQVSMSIGVGLSALVLNLTLQWRGTTELGPDDFWPAFAIIGLGSCLSLLFFIRLPAHAGNELSGHGAVAKTSDIEH